MYLHMWTGGTAYTYLRATHTPEVVDHDFARAIILVYNCIHFIPAFQLAWLAQWGLLRRVP